jgi:hypothetical protein
MMTHPSYKKMIDWRAAQAAIISNNTYDPQVIADGMDAINQKYKAYVFVKRAGYRYENFRIELQNSFEAGNDNFPDDIIEASRRLDTMLLKLKRRIQLHSFNNMAKLKVANIGKREAQRKKII